MSRWMGRALLAVGMMWLTGCAGKAADSFTLEVDLPAGFAVVGDASYAPASGEVCKLPRRNGRRPELKIFKAASKPVANRVSFEVPFTEQVNGCPLVLRRLVFAINASWGQRWSDIGRDYAVIYFHDSWEPGMPLMPETGVQELPGRCQWLFRTAGPKHAILKILWCKSLDAAGKLKRARPGGHVHRDGLSGKTLRMVLAFTEEEEPAVADNWVKVAGGWRRCRGESEEDLFAFCRGNVVDFKRFKMPDGRLCDVYPACN
ncbi:hypothetical protein [Pseudomonas sp. R11-23-07]|uniref:hypothetical protein n=1 Tax=Pseudomonas sp. R11-23-07 TaxID=658632 RepID=UPI000F58AF32|nr:hypothetical protein [Pseudomonas sp. R11-23-07]AZF57785.1 lipoprotein [Pseudomonas sp. R11-23-07]